VTAPDLDNLLRLLDERDSDAIGSGDPTFWGTGRGVLTTGEVRRALLGETVHEGLAS
jgi:hypothetical protein